jgi:hypothetical protein
VDQLGVARRESRQTWFIAVIAIATLFIAGTPVVEAAVNATKIKGKVKVADSTGGTIDAKNVPDMGLLDAPGSNGALAVRNFAGGGGLLGTGDCTEAADPRPNSVTVPANANTVITAIIVTGTAANVAVSAPDLDPLIGPGPVVTFQANESNPNVFVGLGNGLTVTPSELVFTCTGGSGNFVILGQ